MSSFRANLFISLTWGLFLYVHANGDRADHYAPVVQTTLGSLKGTYVPVKGKETGAHAFLGVPFAKPPVAALRLTPPQPVEGWSGEKDATQQPPMCIQMKEVSVEPFSKLGLEVEIPDVSEDCLYLNIYSPANRAPDAKLPVMVWIHGGGFTLGAASSYDGSAMAAYEDVVVVLIQYRLGLLGLFSTGEPDMAGNFGLLDQVEALKWVQQHIHNFGGNPDLVTIYGESAGGMSVSLLHLSPLSNGLFHHAIAQSGTAALFELMQVDPLPVAQMVANMSGCGTESTEMIRDCVRNLDVQKLVELTEIQELRFTLTVDGRFLTQSVDESFRNHDIIKVPFMTGVTSDEAGWLLPTFMAPQNWTEGMTRQEVKSILFILFYPDPNNVALDLMIDEYTGKSEDPHKLRKAFTDLLGDFLFNIPALKTINAHKDAGAPVYLYEYNFALQMLKKLRPDFVGTDHGDDIFIMFGSCFTTKHVKIVAECSKEEEELTKSVMKYWANFARTGSPNGEGLVHWPQYGKEENYLFIDTEQVVRQQLRKERFEFMTQTLPKIIAPVVQTTLGSLKGTYVTVKGKETGAHSFLGVPFAKPPVAALRLTPPQPVEGWSGEKDATQQPPMCIQNKPAVELLFSQIGVKAEIPDVSEDCLYLNIYSPANRAPDAKLPVMVWIHGGTLVFGAASSYDGSAMAAYEDVVVVLIQYRLGLLGFFSTGEADMAGNFGFLDQVEALKWVQQHIHNFGGNPDLVTIYGESAGGWSVSYQHLSPLSNGLFHRGIAQSGTAALELMQRDPLPVAQMVANMSGCSTESTDIIADCVRNLDLQKLLEIAQINDLTYPITVDGLFLTKSVDELYRNHEIIKVPFMTGVTSDEGGWLLAGSMAPPNWTEGMTREEVKSVLSFFYPDPKDVALNLIIDEYTGKCEDPQKLRKAFTQLLGDFLFNFPARKTTNAHKDAGAPVYFYKFNFAPRMLQKIRPDFVGADHADDLLAVFGFCFTTTHIKIMEECSKEEEDISKRVMKYWANFARTGSPNGAGLVHWPQYGQEENYLIIDTEQAVSQQLWKERFVFMTQTLPKMLQELEGKEHKEL
uniref:Carboxylesterase type B domain-containing protein n=2 Tax=Neogobius melanostomus TaxID=47308 RepID=A0A8C6WX02_9GOBI